MSSLIQPLTAEHFPTCIPPLQWGYYCSDGYTKRTLRIFHVSSPQIIEEKLAHIAPWLSLEVEPAQWLVIAPSGTTTKELCERVGIEFGQSNGIVVRFDSYYGVSQPSVWEWISSKRGVALGAVATT